MNKAWGSKAVAICVYFVKYNIMNSMFDLFLKFSLIMVFISCSMGKYYNNMLKKQKDNTETPTTLNSTNAPDVSESLECDHESKESKVRSSNSDNNKNTAKIMYQMFNNTATISAVR